MFLLKYSIDISDKISYNIVIILGLVEGDYMIEHENPNTNIEDPYSIWTQKNLTWNTHFHYAIECIILLKGEIFCTVTGETHRLQEREAVFIMQNQIHSIETKKESEILIMRFLPEFIGTFFHAYRNKIPENNKFVVPQEVELPGHEMYKADNVFLAKALVYRIVGEFCRQVTVWNKQTKESNLIRNMIQYVDDNFTADISLTKLAKQLNYNYSYMSAEFLRIMGMSFMDYVNNCRVNHACYLLKNTKLSITDIAHESGYQSIRTFNRNFLKYANTTPAKYLKSN